jgi:hypothetical protein
VAALEKVWEIFDYPCGQRLAPLLKIEVRAKGIWGLLIADEVVGKLKRISVGTIDLPIDKSYILNDPTTVASVT